LETAAKTFSHCRWSPSQNGAWGPETRSRAYEGGHKVIWDNAAP
jgi:hypothetical protein